LQGLSLLISLNVRGFSCAISSLKKFLPKKDYSWQLDERCFLSDCLLVYDENKIVEKLSKSSTIDNCFLQKKKKTIDNCCDMKKRHYNFGYT